MTDWRQKNPFQKAIIWITWSAIATVAVGLIVFGGMSCVSHEQKANRAYWGGLKAGQATTAASGFFVDVYSAWAAAAAKPYNLEKIQLAGNGQKVWRAIYKSGQCRYTFLIWKPNSLSDPTVKTWYDCKDKLADPNNPQV